MPGANDWNQGIISEFRANEGRVGGMFEGASMILVHHVGRASGKEYVSPLVYLPGDNGDGAMYIFASKGGAPTHPDWYRNLIAAGKATVEVGLDTFDVTVTEVTGKNATASTRSRSSGRPASASTRRRPRASARSRCCVSRAANRAQQPGTAWCAAFPVRPEPYFR